MKINNILISTVRPNLKHYCFIKKAKPNLIASTGFAVIGSQKDKSDPFFLYNLLTTTEYTNFLIKIANTQTSTYPAFNPSVIVNSKILLPPLPEQKAIAAVLSSLDDKVELLREENKTLESIAQTIFKEWFVKFNFPCLPENYEFSGAHKPDDFDSVCTYQVVGGLPAPQKDKHFLYVLLCSDKSFYIGITENLYKRWYEHKKAQGAKWTKGKKPLKVIHWEEYTSRTEVCKREKWLKTGFGRKWLKREYNAGRLRQAGKMVNSELGEIPEGWKVGKIKDKIKTILGGTPSRNNKSYWENGTISWINSGAINDFPIMRASEYITETGLKNSAAEPMPPRTVVLPFVITPGSDYKN
ncbi:MAG: restriction endonuclease subunit S [Candidatus Ratteibacteria bacterium]